MKTNIEFNLDFTISKITGILIALGGIALGFYLKSETAAVTITGIGAAMITAKTIVQNKKSNV